MSLRIASVGLTLYDDRVTPIAFKSTATLLDQDVVLFRPSVVPGDYQAEAFGGIYKGARSISQNDSPRFDADIARRKKELQALLDRGGTLVLFVPAPSHWYIDTGKREHSGTGRNRQTTTIVDRRELLSLLPFPISTEAGGSRDLEVTGGSPFAAFWRAIDGKMEAAAYFTVPFGNPTLRIRGTENAVVAAIERVGSGVVIALPEHLLYEELPDDWLERQEEDAEGDEEEDGELPEHPEEVAFVTALLELVRETRVEQGDFAQPEWASSFFLPTEEEGLESVRKQERAVERAQEKLVTVQARVDVLRRRKTLFTGGGTALEILVEEALTALGFKVEPGPPGRTDRVIRHPDHGPGVVESKGKGKSAAEKDSAQLEKWVSEHYTAHEEKAKPVLVVNAWKDTPLAERTEEAFPDQMLEYAEARQHCLMTGWQLLCAWLEVEAHPDRKPEISSQIVSTVGRFTRYATWSDWISTPELPTGVDES